MAESDASSPYSGAVVHGPLGVDALRQARAGRRLGHDVRYLQTIDSTNDHAKQLALEGAAEGTVVIADQQTKGRGRLGRVWESPAFRNLYLSLVLRPRLDAAQAPQLALVAGLAVADAVRAWVPAATIKWPNDVVIDGRKVAGILAEMETAEHQVRFVIVGIGVNLNSAPGDFPPELRDKAVAVCAVSGAPVDRVEFTNYLLTQFEERYDTYLRHGFAAIRPAWESVSSLSGQQVVIDDGGQRYAGVVAGMADDGALRLRDAAGRERAIVAGDVTVVGGYGEGTQASTGHGETVR